MKTFCGSNMFYFIDVLNDAIATIDKEIWPVSVKSFFDVMCQKNLEKYSSAKSVSHWNVFLQICFSKN